MNNLKVIIVDDEPIAQNIIELYCLKLPNITVLAKCNNAFEARQILFEHKPDLIFLDINMPGISGIDFAKSLSQCPDIIFTTAYSEYAVMSYELSALDYLVKPISFERFYTAVNKASKFKPSQNTLNSNISQSLQISEPENVIFVRSEGKNVKINLNELLFIEGLKDYVKFCNIDSKIIVHGTLKRIEEYLNERQTSFLRVHKSYIINTKKIKQFSSDLITLTSDNITIPLGQTYMKNLENLINDKRY